MVALQHFSQCFSLTEQTYTAIDVGKICVQLIVAQKAPDIVSTVRTNHQEFIAAAVKVFDNVIEPRKQYDFIDTLLHDTAATVKQERHSPEWHAYFPSYDR